ncbi:sensor histidine kinase [Chitinophaga cymbidii]|uniref:Signal transduction histidine kinase internal region domain-containing protein n=1 Tax=Chitinophaga cymbidii TaxID=1096750 RepID=A0A512RSY2_9BACT|nr:histidine kinase [Chitinophaga cymbidii]GEP98810.1 hypothetical protein CCY01nite_50700 [Chitinophaga cymbidii]
MERIRKIEFWIVTGIYLLFVFALFFPSLYHGTFAMRVGYWRAFDRNGMEYDPFVHYMLPRLTVATFGYVTFLLINHWIVPVFLEKKQFWAGVPLAIATFVLFFLMTMVATSYYYGFMLGYRDVSDFHGYCATRALGATMLGAILYGFYYAVKYIYFRFLHDKLVEKKVWKKLPAETPVLVGVWVCVMILLEPIFNMSNAEWYLIFWSGPTFIPANILLQLYVYPKFMSDRRKWPLTMRLLLVIMGTAFVAAFFFGLGERRSHMIISAFFLYCLGVMLGVIPLAWWLFKMRLSRKDEVLSLEKALGRSSANLDFLRSQINPHFLFNALNTLYGTALQENAPRTSEGVQRLGDMMRFMLHENHLEKIELSKEIAYLQNYVSLQRLRTQASEDIKIEVNVEEDDCDHTIAPMLLIPFVENAFKHGISLRKRSWIVVSLSCDRTHIYFDAYNSVHPKPENDPEKASLGIGLNNVKRRLALLYPRKHELSIRQTATEFFVHLTIDTTR